MWIVLTGERCGTRDFFDTETMTPLYTRATAPTWHRQDDGTLKANVANGVALELCEKYPNIHPVESTNDAQASEEGPDKGADADDEADGDEVAVDADTDTDTDAE